MVKDKKDDLDLVNYCQLLLSIPHRSTHRQLHLVQAQSVPVLVVVVHDVLVIAVLVVVFAVGGGLCFAKIVNLHVDNHFS
jgi:hypothetical protein